jgi:hypothetical protein
MYTILSFDVGSNNGSYRTSRNEYKLNFTINNKVKISKTVLVPTNMYSFRLTSDIFNDSYDNNYLVDKWLPLFSYHFDYIFTQIQ